MAFRRKLQDPYPILPTARFVLIHKSVKAKHKYIVGILDNAFNYAERSTVLLTKAQGWYALQRINKLFEGFRFVKGTKIIFVGNTNRTFGWGDPILKYIDFFGMHILFRRRMVYIDKIPRRIRAYHKALCFYKRKDSSISRKDILPFWDKMVELGYCPWITKEVDNDLKFERKSDRKLSIICRMGVYYMLVSQHFSELSRKSEAKRQLRLVQQNNISDDSLDDESDESFNEQNNEETTNVQYETEDTTV